MNRIYSALTLTLLYASISFAQTRPVVVSGLDNGARETSEIRALRFATLEEQSVVRLGDKYEVGDELTGSGAVGIELRCPEGSLVKFSQKFRVVLVVAQASQDCAINLLAGKADIITNRPTTVQSGEVTAGSRGTVYSLYAARGAQGPTVACAVFDGAVAVSSPQSSSRLEAGLKKTWSPAAPTTLKLSPEDLRQTAVLYARMDVSKGRASGAAVSPAVIAELASAYLRVFQTPADVEARIDLAANQANLKLLTDSIYHLNRAEQLSPQTNKPQQARIAIVRSAAYDRAGDGRKAAEQAERARQIDPDVLKSKDLERYKIDPKRIPIPPPPVAPKSERSGTSPTVKDTSHSTATIPQREAPTAVVGGGATASRNPAGTGTAVAVRAGALAADVPETSVLLDLVSRGQYDEAIAGFLKRMDRFGQSARDACGLALAYSRLRRRDEAIRYATLAIQLDEKLKQLSNNELKTCRDIRSSR